MTPELMARLVAATDKLVARYGPPPVVVQPPPPPPVNTGSGLSGLQLLADDFTAYKSTADLQRAISTNIGGTGTGSVLYGDGHNPQLAAIDPTVLYNGHPSLKYTQPSGVADTPQLFVGLPKGLAHMWYRVKVRFSQGFTTTGSLPASQSSNAYKLLSWGWNAYDGSARIEITNTNQIQVYENVQSKSNGSLVGGGNYLLGVQIQNEWTDGQWYDYIIEADHSQKTGVVRFWRAKDGDKPVLVGSVNETMRDGSLMPAITGVTVGLNFNQIRKQAQSLWWGQWEVIDGTQHANPFGL